MKVHTLKTAREYFEKVAEGSKNFECRFNDRDFKEKDILLLAKLNDKGNYTGEYIIYGIQYLLKDFVGLKEGYVIIALGSYRAEDLPETELSKLKRDIDFIKSHSQKLH